MKLWLKTLICWCFIATLSISPQSLSIPSINYAPAILDHNPIPPALANNMWQSINQIYGKDAAPAIYTQILHIIATIYANRPIKLRKEDVQRNPTWYKNEIVYMLYADDFAAPSLNQKSNFHNLQYMVPYLKQLGVTTVYILPFLASPLKDGGFDVANFTQIRPSLGNMHDLQQFINLLHANGIKVASDLVLNHISDQHQWFQQALAGDKQKLNYFLVKQQLPPFHRYFEPRRGEVVDYTESNGLISSRRLIFPELTASHYRAAVINGKKYYFYHTFYPFQLDINWKNPKVLYAKLKDIGFWCNQGIDIFRLDAIPFLIKNDGSPSENLPQTHAIIRLISSFIQIIGPQTVLQAEAGQLPQDVIPYFGKEQQYIYTNEMGILPIKRTTEAQLAYNFPLMPALWEVLLLGNSQNFWDIYTQIPPIPDTSSWNIFLRVHDELTLEMVDKTKRKILYNLLQKRGASFRNGLGVAGRMANFLDQDPRRITQAFALLMSLPGAPVIYYGDEIGALNNWEFAQAKAWKRKKTSANLKFNSAFDSRDINRGPILRYNFIQAINQPNSFAGKIYYSLKHDIYLRHNFLALSIGSLSKISASNPFILAYLRNYNNNNILVIHNFKNQAITTLIKLPNNLHFANQVKDLRTNAQIKLIKQGAQVQLTLNPYQSMWLKF